MSEWMQMSELAEAYGFDVFDLRDQLENLGLFHAGPTEVALAHDFAVQTSGNMGGMMTLWHRDVVVLLGGSRLPEQMNLFDSFDLFNCSDPEKECGDSADLIEESTLSEELEGEESSSGAQPISSQNTVKKEKLRGGGSVSSSVRPGKPVGKVRTGFDAVIATDGACKGNPGPGGWAWVEQLTGDHESGGASHTTNNVMELTALIQALEYVGQEKNILLRIDSQYVINSMTKWAPGWRKRGWRKAGGEPVANRELIERLLNLYEGRTGRTEVEWVKGHNGDAANELVDSLAVAESSRYV